MKILSSLKFIKIEGIAFNNKNSIAENCEPNDRYALKIFKADEKTNIKRIDKRKTQIIYVMQYLMMIN